MRNNEEEEECPVCLTTCGLRLDGLLRKHDRLLAEDWMMVCPGSLKEPNFSPIPDYVIYSGEHAAFWRAKSSGYCRELLGAGLYTLKEAKRAANRCGPEKRIRIITLAKAWQDWLGSGPQEGTVGFALSVTDSTWLQIYYPSLCASPPRPKSIDRAEMEELDDER